MSITMGCGRPLNFSMLRSGRDMNSWEEISVLVLHPSCYNLESRVLPEHSLNQMLGIRIEQRTRTRDIDYRTQADGGVSCSLCRPTSSVRSSASDVWYLTGQFQLHARSRSSKPHRCILCLVVACIDSNTALG